MFTLEQNRFTIERTVLLVDMLFSVRDSRPVAPLNADPERSPCLQTCLPYCVCGSLKHHPLPSDNPPQNITMDIFLPELLGTMLLIILGDGVVANVVLGKTKGQNSGWIVIATGWGMAVVVGVYAVAGYTVPHINPAVTITLVSIAHL